MSSTQQTNNTTTMSAPKQTKKTLAELIQNHIPQEIFNNIHDKTMGLIAPTAQGIIININESYYPPESLAIDKKTRDQFACEYYRVCRFQGSGKDIIRWLKSLPAEYRKLIHDLHVWVVPGGRVPMPPLGVKRSEEDLLYECELEKAVNKKQQVKDLLCGLVELEGRQAHADREVSCWCYEITTYGYEEDYAWSPYRRSAEAKAL